MNLVEQRISFEKSRCLIEPLFLGNLKIVELLVEHGAEDIDAAMNLAAANGKLKNSILK